MEIFVAPPLLIVPNMTYKGYINFFLLKAFWPRAAHK